MTDIAAYPIVDTNRDAVIYRLRVALRQRTGRTWSVTGGRGTAWGWIKIDAPPARQTWRHRLREGATFDRPEDYEEYDSGRPGGHMSPADRLELAAFMGLERVHVDGISIPASSDYYTEHVDRAEGRAPRVTGRPYWD